MPSPTVSVERLPQARVRLKAVFDAAETAKAEKKALDRLAQTVKLEGFRPGKAPADMVKSKISPDQLFEETVHILVREHLGKLIEENKLMPIISPRIEAISRDPVTVQVTVVERPDVKVKGADKMKVDRKEMKVEEKDVQRVIDSVLAQFAIETPVERAAAMGDKVIVDFRGEDKDGKDIPGASATDFDIHLGKGSLVPGFEEAVVGLKPKDSKSFTVTMPEKYHAPELAGQPVTFHITMKNVASVVEPTLTDEFTKDKLGTPTAAEFRAQVEKNISAQDERYESQRREHALLDLIRNATTVELAQELIESETQGLLNDLADRLQQQGQTLAQWVKASGKKPQEIEEDMKKQAQDRLKLRFGLAQLIEDKKIELSKEEMDAIVKETTGGKTTGVTEGDMTERLQNELWRAKVEKLIEGMLQN